MSSIQLLLVIKLLIFLPSHRFLNLFFIWFQTWIEKRYIINGFPQNSNILYKYKLMLLLCNIFELCLQMTITCIYFCLLFLLQAMKYLSDQIFCINSKSEKGRGRKKWNEILSKWYRFVVLCNYAVLHCILP